MSAIIDYIVKYQNDYSSSYIFLKNLPLILEKGIEIKPLLDSQVFSFEFDYDEWPGTHSNDSKELRPYNESIYALRKHYRTVFFEDEFKDIHEMEDS